ncbi:hypothetical protein N657DRAFT_4523 [Parathielavia appendiculata]|uniref:Uncharacterized protein n=1 Tax=Parathielavia appendiculata TaxID=2587402 RepID=A0AAN6U7Z1_9PEZI|nr:hypothetical protein N657DRAFT_4523 [Parathielavia appendiculata]
MDPRGGKTGRAVCLIRTPFRLMGRDTDVHVFLACRRESLVGEGAEGGGYFCKVAIAYMILAAERERQEEGDEQAAEQEDEEEELLDFERVKIDKLVLWYAIVLDICLGTGSGIPRPRWLPTYCTKVDGQGHATDHQLANFHRPTTTPLCDSLASQNCESVTKTF